MREINAAINCPREEKFINIQNCNSCEYYHKTNYGHTPETRGAIGVVCEYGYVIKCVICKEEIPEDHVRLMFEKDDKYFNICMSCEGKSLKFEEE